MRIPQDPLNDREVQELSSLLDASGGRTVEFARGVFAAVATAPTELEPTAWIPLLVGDETPDSASLRTLFGLLLRDYNSCADCLELRVPAVPYPDEQAVRDFCRGYVQIAHRDSRWTSDTQAFELTVPLAVLAGYAEPESLKTVDQAAAEDPDAYRASHRAALGDDVAALYEHFRSARAEAKAATPARSSKVGRNEPCPCGSGKKYKKCCGA